MRNVRCGAVIAAPLAVTATGVVSAAGFGLGPLADVFAGVARPHSVPTDADGADHPLRPLRTVAPFDRTLVGCLCPRDRDRRCQFGLRAATQALDALPGAGFARVRPERTGLVVGTTAGAEFVLEEPFAVPTTCTGVIALRQGLLGVNATLSGGALTWLLAVRYARTVLADDRADRLVVGAADEVTASTAWEWHQSGVLSQDTPLGEGAAFFAVQRRAAVEAPVAELLGCEVGYFGDATPALVGGLRRCITEALQRSGLTAADVDVIVPGTTGHLRLARLERRALAAELRALPPVLNVVPRLGEAHSAGGAFQLAALLATTPASTAGRIGLITSVGEDGGAGALVVRC